MKPYVEDVGVEVPGGGVGVGEEVPEPLRGDLAQLGVVLRLSEDLPEVLVRGEVNLDPGGEETGGEVLHGVDPPVPEQEVEEDPEEASSHPHHRVSTLEVEGVEATLELVEVLGDLHVPVGGQPVPGGGDQVGKESCGVLAGR